jgi:cytochrome c oxidase cbb3-type subunit I
MSVTASPAQTAPRPQPQSAVNEIEASCRLPLLALFGGGVFWLFIGSLFALIASLKFHDPRFLANEPCLTYGRVHAAHITALLYGFGVPAALGVGIWLLCRLGRAPLAASGAVLIGIIFWNAAVAIGLAAIICGQNTGFESFEMPRYASVVLFVSYLLIALCGVLTFHRRAEERLYPSQWFVLGSFFWFPWIFSTAAALLLCLPVRGVVQSSVAWWYAHNFSTIFLGFAGLASIFYFIPKLLGRPLHSSYLAGLAFWTLALFGSWGGIPGGAPLPSWIISLGVVGTVLTAVPVLAVAVNFYQTVHHDLHALDGQITLRFTYVALFFWLIAGVQEIVGVLPNVSALTNYTWFAVAHWELFHYGFFTFAMFGAIYYIVPRLLDRVDSPAWSPGLVKGHFWLTLAGVLISSLALLVGGVGQGYLLNDVNNSFPQVMAATLMPLRLSTLGDLFIVIGTVLFLLNLALLLARCCCRCWTECKNFAGTGKEGA